MDVAGNVLDVLSEHAGSVACGEDGINVGAFLGHFEDGVEVPGEVTALVLPFLAVAAAEADSDDGALLVVDGSFHLIENKELVELLDTVQDTAGAPVVEDGGKFLCPCFQEGGLAATSGDGVVVGAGLQVLADNLLDVSGSGRALGRTAFLWGCCLLGGSLAVWLRNWLFCLRFGSRSGFLDGQGDRFDVHGIGFGGECVFDVVDFHFVFFLLNESWLHHAFFFEAYEMVVSENDMIQDGDIHDRP